jgi:acetyl esterase/lipase
MLQKLTQEFANHGMPILCDIYTDTDYPADTPVVLYFHAGGLVGWGRTAVPPWLVQVSLPMCLHYLF